MVVARQIANNSPMHGAAGTATHVLTGVMWWVIACSSGAPRAIEGSGSDGPLLCQRLLLAADRSTEVVLDPSAYDYQGCSCKAPFRAESTVLGGMITNMRCVVNQVCLV
jgi:hypothetical protein